jgi:hypothetical protein
MPFVRKAAVPMNDERKAESDKRWREIDAELALKQANPPWLYSSVRR